MISENIRKHLNEADKAPININNPNEALKLCKKLIKDPDYFYDNHTKYDDGSGYLDYIYPCHSDKDYYEAVYRYILRYKTITKKTPQEDLDKYMKALSELKDYATECNNRKAVKGIENLIQVKFSKFDFEGNAQKEQDQRGTTYYALFSDGGNPYSYLNSSSAGKSSCKWNWIKSKKETKAEFRQRAKNEAMWAANWNYYSSNPSALDLKIFEDKDKFLSACNAVGIHPRV